MICLICRRADIIGGFTSIGFERREMHLMINNVPAHVCPDCGEAYVVKEVAVQLLQRAEEIYKEGILEEVIDYERL
jgi:YgiT-type zinc finger domain-containing protein